MPNIRDNNALFKFTEVIDCVCWQQIRIGGAAQAKVCVSDLKWSQNMPNDKYIPGKLGIV